MKKLPIICPDLSGKGGTESVLKLLSIYSQEHSLYNIELVLPYKTEDQAWLKNLQFVSVQNKSRVRLINKFKGILFLLKYLFSDKSSSYICLSTQLVYILAVFRFFSKRKFTIISWIHFSLLHEKTVNLSKLKKADFHLAISSGIKKQMEKIGIRSEQIYLIYNPIKPNFDIKFNETADKTKNFVYLGRIIYKGQKNLKELLQAISMVNGDWKLYIVGTGNENEISLCQNLIKKNHIEDKVRFVGWLSEPWRELKKIDAVLLSSRYEGFPMVLLEAMSRGIVCISSNCPTGPADIIQHKANGYLYETGDMKSLSGLIQHVVDEKDIIIKEDISASISRFYIDEYMDNFVKAISEIDSKKVIA